MMAKIVLLNVKLETKLIRNGSDYRNIYVSNPEIIYDFMI